MKNIYTAYTREINNHTHYFIKKYISLPELKMVPPILEAMGMHQDFMKACDLAEVKDGEALDSMMKQLGLSRVRNEVIPIHQLAKEQPAPKRYPLFRNAQNLLQKLRLANI